MVIRFIHGLSWGHSGDRNHFLHSIVITASPERRGAENVTFLTGLDLGVDISSVINGFVAQTAGYWSTYLWTLTTVLLASLSFLFRGEKNEMEYLRYWAFVSVLINHPLHYRLKYTFPLQLL